MAANLQTPSSSKWDSLSQILKRQFTGAQLARNVPRGVWASHQRKDPVFGPIMAYLSMSGKGTSQRVDKRLHAVSQSYQMRGGLLHHRSIRDLGVSAIGEGWAVVVPHSLEQKVIEESHCDGTFGHRGVTKTVWAIRRRYYIKKIRAKVQQFIRKCRTCTQAKSLSLIHI